MIVLGRVDLHAMNLEEPLKFVVVFLMDNLPSDTDPSYLRGQVLLHTHLSGSQALL